MLHLHILILNFYNALIFVINDNQYSVLLSPCYKLTSASNNLPPSGHVWHVHRGGSCPGLSLVRLSQYWALIGQSGTILGSDWLIAHPMTRDRAGGGPEVGTRSSGHITLSHITVKLRVRHQVHININPFFFIPGKYYYVTLFS